MIRTERSRILRNRASSGELQNVCDGHGCHGRRRRSGGDNRTAHCVMKRVRVWVQVQGLGGSGVPGPAGGRAGARSMTRRGSVDEPAVGIARRRGSSGARKGEKRQRERRGEAARDGASVCVGRGGGSLI